MHNALSQEQIAQLDAYWRAANYLTVGQIYLQENPLLREPLRAEHIKARLLGHWGTSPGLSFIYVHLNRLIRETGASVIYLAGPGHGGPALLANVYLEGTYSEIYPEVSQDAAGMRRLFRQFSTPGGVPSHVSVPTPGSIHEGGELGYVLTHAFGAAFDNPNLLVVGVVGDGEAETGPLEGSWKGVHFLNPVRDGAVLPILHLNGYKISGPTVLGRSSNDEVAALLAGQGYEPHFVEGNDPSVMHPRFATTLDNCWARIRAIQDEARDVFKRNAGNKNFRLFCPDETNSNRLGDVFEVETRCSMDPVLPTDERISPEGRVMEVLSEHNCQGWLEGYALTGRHGLFASYEAFAMVSASMTVQHAKWLEEGVKLSWRKPIPSLNILLTSTCWRNDHNGFSHQGPGLIDVVLSKKGTVSRIYLPPDANCLLSVADHCLRSCNYVNLIVIDKQPQLQWLDMPAAREHCAKGASIWRWASNDDGGDPDIVLAAAGDIPTLEVVAAAWWLRRNAPRMRVRVVNVADLMTLFTPDVHPHGMDESTFVSLFTRETDVVFAFHGYQRAIHESVHGRPNAQRFHVRGFNEEGTTTTPFDMVVRNGISRYHLCIEALRRAHPEPGRGSWQTDVLIDQCKAMLERHQTYVRERLEDMPEVAGWKWTDP